MASGLDRPARSTALGRRQVLPDPLPQVEVSGVRVAVVAVDLVLALVGFVAPDAVGMVGLVVEDQDVLLPARAPQHAVQDARVALDVFRGFDLDALERARRIALLVQARVPRPARWASSASGVM
jgi:hypothetical protein